MDGGGGLLVLGKCFGYYVFCWGERFRGRTGGTGVLC